MISKIANWIVWTALTVVVLVLLYQNTAWFKPAADKTMESVKSVAAKVPGTSMGKGGSAEKLDGARDAFARGDVDAAVKMYTDYIKANANDPDARGELGNVYYMVGRMHDAAASYGEAANLLMAKKEYDRVEPLLPIIAQGDPTLADEIVGKLQQGLDAQYQGPAESASAPPMQQGPQSALTRY